MILTSPHRFIFRDVVFAHGWLRLAPFRWEEETGRLHRVEQLPSGRVVELAFAAPAEGLVEGVRVEIAGGEAGLSVSDREAVAALELALAMLRWDGEMPPPLDAQVGLGAAVQARLGGDAMCAWRQWREERRRLALTP